MASTPTDLKFTYEDYLEFPEDGNRHELIEGEHYVTPAPLTKHQRISSNLIAHIHHHCQRTLAGLVLAAPTDVVFSETDVVQPDLVFITKSRQPIVTRENIQGAPDFIVEIHSDSTRRRDERTKRTLYKRYQVSEYWIVDPELETVKIFRLKERRYVVIEESTTEQPKTSLSTSLLPGFSITLKDVFS
ncbi:Uma2 family endonuclease [Candidatus Nitrospira salsa]